MRYRKGASVPISADKQVFDYLQEKVAERKTKTEAYCDLLDKALAGFVSPFVIRKDVKLGDCQCHVTITDLASDWHWNRGTVRLFLDRLEQLQQIQKQKLPKSVLITMPVAAEVIKADINTTNGITPAVLQTILADWAVGQKTNETVVSEIEQLLSSEESISAEADTHISDNIQSSAVKDDRKVSTAKETAHKEQTPHASEPAILGAIATTAMRAVVKTHSGDTPDKCLAAIHQFYANELAGDLSRFLEAAKVIAELVSTGKPAALDKMPSEERAMLLSLLPAFTAWLLTDNGTPCSD